MIGIAAKYGIGKPGADKPLQQHINWYVGQGYRIIAQTETSAQLIKPKQFSLIWALLWFLLFGIGLIVYIIYYAAKKDKAVYLTITAEGKVQAG